MGNYNFDLDLPVGQGGERLVQEILAGERGTVEVKRDFIVSESGRVAIEFLCRGRPSGIATSTATWWAIILDGAKFGHEVTIIIKTRRLREMARDFYKRGSWASGGDDAASRMVLIPVQELVHWYPPIVKPELV